MTKTLHSAKYYICCYFIAFLSLIPPFLINAHAEDPAGSAGTFQVTDIEWAENDNEFWVAIVGETPPVYTVYELLDPLRIVIDFANASLIFPINMNLAADELPITNIRGNELKNQDPTIARIELILTEDRSYTVEREGNDVIVVFREKAPVVKVETPKPATPSPQPIVQRPYIPVAPKALPASMLQGNATVIFDVKVETSHGETRINVRADGPIKNFNKAELAKTSGRPNRMYVDIPNIRMPRLMRKNNINSMLAGIRMARRGSGIRIVFDSALDSLFPYSMMTSHEGLLVTIGEGAFAEPAPTYTEPVAPIVEVAEVTAPAPVPVQPVTIEPTLEITEIDTEPIPEPEPVAIKEEKKPEPKAVAKAKPLPPITELIQPVITATPTVQPERHQPATASVQPSVSQKDITKETEKTKKKPGITDEFGFSGYETQRITIDFFKVDLHNVFRLFGEISNRNIVIAEGVSGSLTLALKDVPWDFALDIILNLKDLQKEEQFQTLVISPKSKNFTWPDRASKKIAFKADESISIDESEPISIKKRDDTPRETIEAQKFIRQAQLKERKGDYKGALALYEKSYNIWPQNTQLAKRIASLALVNLKMHAKGAHYAEMALKANPSDYDAALLAAIGFANMKKVSSAKQYFDQAISSPRPSSESLINYATFCEEFQSYGAALQLYNKHQEVYGYTLDVMIGKARVLDKKGKTTEALGEYKAILHSGFDLPKDLKKYIQGRLAMAK